MALLLAAALANVARDGDAPGLSPAGSHALAGAGPGVREGGAYGVGGTSSGALSVSGRNSRHSTVAARTGAGSVSIAGQHSQQHLGGGAGEDRSVKGAARRVQVSQGGEEAPSSHLASGTLYGGDVDSGEGGAGGTGQLPLPPTPFAAQLVAVGAAAGPDRRSPTSVLRARLAASAEAAAAAAAAAASVTGRAASLADSAMETTGQGRAPAGGDEDSMPLGPMPPRRIDPQLALSGSLSADPPGSPGPGSFSGPYGSGAFGALGGTSSAAWAVVSGLPRVRGASTRRSRLAVVVDEVLMAGQGGVLRGLPPGDAAAVRQLVVVLLALRGQPGAVLLLAQQLRQPAAGGKDGGKGAAAGVDAAGEASGGVQAAGETAAAAGLEADGGLEKGGKAGGAAPVAATGADRENSGGEAQQGGCASPKAAAKAAGDAGLAQVLQVGSGFCLAACMITCCKAHCALLRAAGLSMRLNA